MTTIAWDGKVLAADSQITEGGLRSHQNTEKIIRYHSQFFAYAGTLASCLAVIKWLKKGGKKKDRPELEDIDFAVLHIKAGKAMLYYDDFNPVQQLPPYTAGTGRELALGAILAGATARQAVEIACDVDIKSGLPVLHYET